MGLRSPQTSFTRDWILVSAIQSPRHINHFPLFSPSRVWATPIQKKTRGRIKGMRYLRFLILPKGLGQFGAWSASFWKICNQYHNPNFQVSWGLNKSSRAQGRETMLSRKAKMRAPHLIATPAKTDGTFNHQTRVSLTFLLPLSFWSFFFVRQLL